jgi:Family of unknown function (DUF5675)
MTDLRVLDIFRTSTGDEGTPGAATIDGWPVAWKSWELPWRDNHPLYSCIPPGDYPAALEDNAEFKCQVYRLSGVEGRTGILLHPYNLAGDVLKGLEKQALGCIGVGTDFGVFKAGTSFHVEGPNGPDVEPLQKDQHGIVQSRPALAAIIAALAAPQIIIRVRWAPGVVLP